MTIGELKTALVEFPDELLIFVQGYEGGFAEISEIKKTKVELNHYMEEWNGPHEETSTASTPAVVILRRPNQMPAPI